MSEVRTFVIETLFAAVLSFSSPGFCQAPPAMTADQVMDNYLKATGGKTAWSDLKSIYEKGHKKGVRGTLVRTWVEFPVDYPFELFAERSGKLLVRVQNPDGQRTSVCDGSSVRLDWPQLDVREMKEEGDIAQWCAQPLVSYPLLWRGLHWKIALKGRKKAGGQDAWLLEITPTKGDPQLHYFQSGSGLLVKSEMRSPFCGPPLNIPWPQLGSKCVVEYSDYRGVNGLRFPFTISSRRTYDWSSIPVSETTTFIEEIRTNLAIEDRLFETPKPTDKAASPIPSQSK